MKKVLGFFLLLLVLGLAPPAAAQIYDTPCPAGTSVLGNGQTVNPSNGHLKAYLCVDALGNVTSPQLGTTPSAPGIPSFNGPLLTYASNYGVKATGIRYFDATTTNNSKAVTISNDSNESDIPCSAVMIGWTGFATNYSATGAGTTSTTILQGTVTGCNSATSFQFSNNASATCISSGAPQCELVIWPPNASTGTTDDTAALLAAWNAITSTTLGPNCGTLVLPQGVIVVTNLIQAQISGIANCGASTTGNGAPTGITVTGQGRYATQIIVAPSSNWTGLTSNKGALFYLNNVGSNSVFLKDFSIDGAGQIVTGNGLVPTTGAALALGQNTEAQNVGVLAWGVPTGILCGGGDGAECVLDHVAVTAGSTVPVALGQYSRLESSDVFWAIGTANVTANGTNIHMHGNTFDNPQAAAINLSVTGGEVFSDHDSFTACAVTACKYISVTGGGTLHLDYASAFGGNATSAVGLTVDATPSFAYVGGSHFNITNTSSKALNIAGQLFDLGGNTFAGTAANTVTGTVFGSASATGTAAVAGNWALSAGWGTTAAVSSITGATIRTRYTLTASGTGQAPNPTITHTFATPFLAAPVCSIKQDGGTQPAVANPFTVGAPSTTSVVYTYTGTPTAADTLVLVEDCNIP